MFGFRKKKNCSKKSKEIENKWLDCLTNPGLLLKLSAALVFFALFAPMLFTQCSSPIAFNGDTGVIGDTFGIMNPFVAIAAAVITFAAFGVQYKANQEIRNDNKKQQVLNRFYEMLRIHRENVEELQWISKIHYSPKKDSAKYAKASQLQNENDNQIKSVDGVDELLQKKGRRIFSYYVSEYNAIYRILDIMYPELDWQKKTIKAYNIFYRGVDDVVFDYYKRFDVKNALSQCSDILEFQDKMKTLAKEMNLAEAQQDEFVSTLTQLFLDQDFFLFSPPFYGRFQELNNYYRHLFLIVKTVAKEDDDILPVAEKRNLLRILRAQLTNLEQVMLFYNWISGNGSKWEEKSPNGNHFFTEYRMIHNVLPGAFIPFSIRKGDYWKDFMKFINEKMPVEKYCTNDDPMFEFEEVEGNPKFEYDK